MSSAPHVPILSGVVTLLVSLSARAAPEPACVTNAWPASAVGFQAFGERMAALAPRNLLARPVARLHGVDPETAALLTDGEAGTLGEEGRVFLDGTPSIIACYLGAPKRPTSVAVWSCNWDARANQDYEVRFADNRAQPGKRPDFPGPAALTTGPTVIGANGGGFRGAFEAPEGGALTTGLVDWVEFRVWRTYPVKAGQPGKAQSSANSAAVLVELQVLGAADDVVVVPPAELARRQALAALARQPPFTKLPTWQETAQAAREALLAWESDIDRLVLPETGVTPGPWYGLGPFDPDSPAVRHLDSLRLCDFDQPVAWPAAAVAAPPRWQPLPDLEDGRLHELAARFQAQPGQVIYVGRTVTVASPGGDQVRLCLGLGLGRGEARCWPRGGACRDPDDATSAVPNQVFWEIGNLAATNHLLARLPVDATGSCRFWCLPHPPGGRRGAGSLATRIGRRAGVLDQLLRDFPDPASQCQIAWEREDSIWQRFRRHAMSRIEPLLTDWVPGNPAFLAAQYNQAVTTRLAAVASNLAVADPALAARCAPWLAAQRTVPLTADVATARARYYAVAATQAALAEAGRLTALRLAVADQQEAFGARYPRGAEYLARAAALETQLGAFFAGALTGQADALTALLALRARLDAESQAILLANPLLGFEKLLLARGGPGFSSNWDGPNHLGNEIVTLSPVQPTGTVTTIHKAGNVSEMDLSCDAARILYSDGRQIQEVGVDGTGHRVISRQTDEHVRHYDACRLPNGQIVFVSTACEQAVPCTGGWYVGNLHVMNDDGSGERRLTFDQDHNWNPCVLEDGRVVYARWEYTDTPHYFTRLLFHMNPDGTGQSEFYGSNSYWPNAMYWPRPIPGRSPQVVCVVSGHHGVGRVGELVLLDPSRGRHEANGVVQRIPGRGKRVEPVIADGLVSETWPRFATPWPLAEPGTNLGAGKYFLAAVKLTPWSPWGIYLVDVFDNLTPLLMGPYAMPIPLRARPTPPVVPSRVDLNRQDALVNLVNVYEGGGLKGFPPGSIKALRVGSHVYRYGGNGDTSASSVEGGWDVKRILGTVPVQPDGSAFFTVPANTPIFVQPLDAEGKAQQIMRSWFVAMPGEIVSCVGCHEKQNQAPPARIPVTLASRAVPSPLTPWNGPVRGFSFDRELQPVLDRRCAGCHNGQPRADGARLPDLRAKRLHPGYTGSYSPSYLALHPHVRRAGFEADYHLAAPAEWQADTSPLVQMLRKGHHGVTLDRDEWERLFTWIDFNIPYPANWQESHRPPEAAQVTRRAQHQAELSGITDNEEQAPELPPVGAFAAPPAEAAPPPPATLAGWPLTNGQAVDAQQAGGAGPRTLDLGGGVTMVFAPVPAGRFVMGDAHGYPDEYPEQVATIERPFHLAVYEVSNAQYARFDPLHDSAFIEGRGKDRFTRGTPVNAPDQPVVRVSWHAAMAFCAWLSRQSAAACTLPTEAEWEYACRAGTATPWSFAGTPERLPAVANLADGSLQGWNWGRVQPNYNDGVAFSAPVGRFKPNAWGLYDMHGNVAEWTLSPYGPYPGSARVTEAGDWRVVRGGSWNDTLRHARSASRWRYVPHQPVYNVGFRVLVRN